MSWCWLNIHKWTKWTQRNLKFIDRKTGKEFVAEVQRRTCEVCGYVDECEV